MQTGARSARHLQTVRRTRSHTSSVDANVLSRSFLIRMDRVAEFLKVAENVGIDKGEIPDLTRAPSSLLDALEAHLAALEGDRAAKSKKK